MEIVINNVKKKIKNKNILNGVSIRVRKGQAYGLIGPNGAGKTTLLRIIMNLYQPTKGNVSINGIEVRTQAFNDLKKNIGCLPENLGLYKELTAWDNLEFFDRIYFPSSTINDRRNRIKKKLEFVELYHKKDEKITFFSIGQKQRLALARAFINDPKLLILDEPTKGLDVEGVFMLRNYIETMKKSGLTIFMNSHHLSEMQKTCDICGFIKNGQLIEEGSFKDLLARYHKTDEQIDLEDIYKAIITK